MFVIDVIPFSRAAPAGTLSYRSRIALEPGALVSVVLRRTAIRALVVHCESVRDVKSVIKRSSFTLSSSEPVKEGSLPEELMAAARAVSRYHAAPLGSTLQALIGEYIMAEKTSSDSCSIFVPYKKVAKNSAGAHARETCEASFSDRVTRYREIITSVLAHQDTVHLIAPTIAEILFWKEQFSDFKPLVITGATTPQKRSALCEKAFDYSGLIITTPGFAWLPLQHRAYYILDRISAGAYVMQKRPYIDIRIAVHYFANETGVSVCSGDLLVPLEYRDTFSEGGFPNVKNITVLDVRKKKPNAPVDLPADTTTFSALPEALLIPIRSEIANGGRVGVFAVRKGYAPTVVCHDCGQVVEDERGVPLCFTIRNGVRSMRSTDGKTMRIADRVCARCTSWNLVPLGIGIERVEEELRKEFPEIPIIVIRSELFRTRAHARNVFDKNSSGPCIVIGTEAALPWLLLLHKEFPLSLAVIASADALLALPFWRARERFARFILFCKALAPRVVIATRHPDDSVLRFAKGALDHSFFSEEAALREVLKYPPFGTLIALHVEGSLTQRNALQLQLEKLLHQYAVTFLPDRPITQTSARRTGIIHLSKGEWPNSALSELLQSLGPSVCVLLDPETLW